MNSFWMTISEKRMTRRRIRPSVARVNTVRGEGEGEEGGGGGGGGEEGEREWEERGRGDLNKYEVDTFQSVVRSPESGAQFQ